MGAFHETYRTTVVPEQCDELGHLNIQHYIQFMYLGGMVLMGEIGLSGEALRQRQLGFAATRRENDFLREFRAGDEVIVESAIERVGSKSLTLQNRLTGMGAAGEAMRAKVIIVLMDMRARAAVAIPDDIGANAAAIAATTPQPTSQETPA